MTGGGRGFGRAIAETLAGLGASVVIASRNAPELDDVANFIKKQGGKALAHDPTVTRASLPGANEVGRIVGSLAGGLLKKVSRELGGNNPLVVLADADVAAAASAGAYSSFQFQGQVCFATGRHIVHRSVADHYVELLAQKAGSSRAENGTSGGRAHPQNRPRSA